jgi:hypothetical protein
METTGLAQPSTLAASTIIVDRSSTMTKSGASQRSPALKQNKMECF